MMAGRGCYATKFLSSYGADPLPVARSMIDDAVAVSASLAPHHSTPSCPPATHLVTVGTSESSSSAIASIDLPSEWRTRAIC